VNRTDHDSMGRAFRAELMKLRRPKVVLGIYGAMAAFAALATVLTFAVAKQAPTVFNRQRPGSISFSLTELATRAGLTQGFLIGAGFAGVIVLVMFAVSVAGEQSNSTLRTLALFEPRRLRLLAGKVAALVAFVVVGYAIAELVGVGAAFAAAAAKGVSMHAWLSGAGVRTIVSAFGDAALSGIGWGLLGVVAAIAFRTVPITLAVTLAWVFPFESIMLRSWSAADRWLPGLLLQGLSSGTGGSGGWTRSLLVVAIYSAIFAAVSGVIFTRRDITA
jgi:ABC-type transport system involved in multi-copper enzyme maturation permease subunit